jgi:hypothetical protein
MKSSILIVIGTLMAACAFASISAPLPVDIVYPQAQILPQKPKDQDSVSLYLLLGINPNSCIPRYTTWSSPPQQTSQRNCFAYPCYQDFVIKIAYKESLIQPKEPMMACLDVLTPIGLSFSFGTLGYGHYTVIDTTSRDTVDTFTVAAKPITAVSLPKPDLSREAPALSRISYDARERLLYLRFDSDQTVSIEAYLLDGKRGVTLSTKRFFKAGTYAFSMSEKKVGNGVMVINLRGDNFVESRHINLTK